MNNSHSVRFLAVFSLAAALLYGCGGESTPPPQPGPDAGPAIPCEGQPDGTGCDDGDFCTTGDQCSSGVCVGTAKTCTASDQCHEVGACDPQTGICSDPPSANTKVCDDDLPCTENDRCTDGICSGTEKVCNDIPSCHIAGACNPDTGVCDYPNDDNGTECNDGDLCTTDDQCTLGVCAGTPPEPCEQPADQCHKAECNPTSGECEVLGLAEFTLCDAHNPCATGKCRLAGTTLFCQGEFNANLEGTPCGEDLPDPVCHSGHVCRQTHCVPVPVPDDPPTSCDDGLLCTDSEVCQGGTCVGQPKVCTAANCYLPGTCDPDSGECSDGPAKVCYTNQTCEEAGSGECEGPGPRCPAPVDANAIDALMMRLSSDVNGNIYIAGTIFSDANIGSIDVICPGCASDAPGDAVVAKIDPATGLAAWAKSFGDSPVDSYGDPLDPDVQSAVDVAVSSTGRVAVIGNFSSSIIDNSTGNLLFFAGSTKNFILGLDVNGDLLWSRSVALGGGDLSAVAGHPNQDSFVVCGFANGVDATSLGAGLTNHGGRDTVVAKIDAATGQTVWAKQFGDAASKDQLCKAAAYDDAGDVLITGQYAGALDFGNDIPALPDPTSTRKGIFVAKLSGADGTALAARGFVGSLGSHMGNSVAVDAHGDVLIAGNLGSTGTVTFGSTQLTSTGGTDAFVAKLSGNDLSALWARRFGGSTGNDNGRGVAVDSFGDVTSVGEFYGSMDIGNGITLTAPGSSDPDVFVVKLNSFDGTTVCGAAYGDGHAQKAEAVIVERLAEGAEKDAVWISGTFAVLIDFGEVAGSFTTPGSGIDRSFLLREK